jgi:type IV secretory pathway VirB2 component (pilin)
MAPIQASIQWVQDVFQGKIGRGVAVTKHPTQRRGYRKSRAILLLLLWVFTASSSVNLHLLLPFTLKRQNAANVIR